MKRNPYAIGLAVAGGFALALAFMLWVITWQITDYAPYDVVAVAELKDAVLFLVISAVVTFTGAIVIAGVAWTARNAAKAGATSSDVARANEYAE